MIAGVGAYCAGCGSELRADQAFCSACGAPSNAQTAGGGPLGPSSPMPVQRAGGPTLNQTGSAASRAYGAATRAPARRLASVVGLALFVLLVAPSVALADRFPDSGDFNGLVIDYAVSGAQMGIPVDAGGFTTSRTITGTLSGGKLEVSGSVRAGNGWSAAVSVTVSAGGNTDSFTAQSPPAPNGLHEAPWSQSFSVSVDVPKGAEGGSFSIVLSGEYNAGGRALAVDGSFAESGAAGESGGGGSAGQDSGDGGSGGNGGGASDDGEGPAAANEVDAEDSGCRFSGIRGEVEFLPPGGGESDWQFARRGVKILVGTRIRTAEESTAVLQFADLSTFVLKPETEVLIKAKPKQTSNFDLVTGKIWVNIKRMIRGESLEVRTARSITGVEGTTFVLEEDGRASTLKVIDGTVRFTATSDGQTTTVEAGETVRATGEGLDEIRTFDIDAEQAEWDGLGANEQMEPDGFPVWLLILIIVIALSILAAVGVMLVRGKKRGSDGNMAPAPVWHPVQAAAGGLRGVVCTKCGLELHEGARFCGRCGQSVAEPLQRERQISFCPGCGNRLQEGARFCPKCGRPA